MGLDNIPKHYPCKTKNTAVLNPRLGRDGEPLLDENGDVMTAIDCAATAACGGCPWKNAYDASGLAGGQVYGMLGTDCWYRGKYGNYLLEQFDLYDDATSFYGDNEDGTEKSAASCLALADHIDDALGGYVDHRGSFVVDGTDIAPDMRYAAWWLRWVASEADGSVCWY